MKNNRKKINNQLILLKKEIGLISPDKNLIDDYINQIQISNNDKEEGFRYAYMFDKIFELLRFENNQVDGETMDLLTDIREKLLLEFNMTIKDFPEIN